MEESAISIFRKLPETKGQITSYKNLIKQSVENGEVDSLVFFKQVVALEQLVKELKQDDIIKDVILEEAERFNQKSFTYSNAKFSIREVGSRYNYQICDDSQWNELNDEMQKLKEKISARENFLKSITPEMEVYGADGVKISPPVKTSSTQVVVTLNK
jgi:hypothetical protein